MSAEQARKDASLELRKARNSTGQLELNQSEVVRLVGILNSTTMPPRLSASPGLVLASGIGWRPESFQRDAGRLCGA
ncbi:hypothetical protein ACW5W8_23635 [Aeromonas aquatilis]